MSSEMVRIDICRFDSLQTTPAYEILASGAHHLRVKLCDVH
jgi:hypothetical protein